MKFTERQIAGLGILEGLGLGLMAASQGKTPILLLGLAIAIIATIGLISGGIK